jgi:anaerobic ribonucleoside-triphosphate reductase
MSSVAIYFSVLAVAIGFGIGAMLTYSPPMRPCYRCGARVRTSARRCRHCGYHFEY